MSPTALAWVRKTVWFICTARYLHLYHSTIAARYLLVILHLYQSSSISFAHTLTQLIQSENVQLQFALILGNP